MANKHLGNGKRRVPKEVLRLPDLDQAKSAVLNSLSSVDAQRGYRLAIEELVEWYCSQPRLSFSRPSFSGIAYTWDLGICEGRVARVSASEMGVIGGGERAVWGRGAERSAPMRTTPAISDSPKGWNTLSRYRGRSPNT